MKIIKFKNGNYAIRRFNILRLGYEYKDLTVNRENSFWWSRSDSHFQDSISNELKIVKNRYDSMLDKGTPI